MIKGWYESKVTGLLNSLMKSPDMTEIRRRWVPEASGDVIEIGVGSGLNLRSISQTLESSLWTLRRAPSVCARWREERHYRRFCAQSGESIPADDNQFDSAVITWTMCTIPNPHDALLEISVCSNRVGIYFAEHGLSPDAGVAKYNIALMALEASRWWGNLNRRPDQMLAEASFTIDHMKQATSKDLNLRPTPIKGLLRHSLLLGQFAFKESVVTAKLLIEETFLVRRGRRVVFMPPDCSTC